MLYVVLTMPTLNKVYLFIYLFTYLFIYLFIITLYLESNIHEIHKLCIFFHDDVNLFWRPPAVEVIF